MWPVLATRIERRPCTRSTEATHFPLNHKVDTPTWGILIRSSEGDRNSLLWINRFLWKAHWCPMFTELEAWGTDGQWTASLPIILDWPPKTQGTESNATPWRTTSHTLSVDDIELPIFRMIRNRLSSIHSKQGFPIYTVRITVPKPRTRGRRKRTPWDFEEIVLPLKQTKSMPRCFSSSRVLDQGT